MKSTEALALMAKCKTKKEWAENEEIVKQSCGGELPIYWGMIKTILALKIIE